MFIRCSGRGRQVFEFIIHSWDFSFKAQKEFNHEFLYSRKSKMHHVVIYFRCLDMGFEPQLRKIADQIRPDRQVGQFKEFIFLYFFLVKCTNDQMNDISSIFSLKNFLQKFELKPFF